MGKQKNRKGFGTKTMTKLGVFASSLLVSASAVYLYSPVIGTHAADTASTVIRTRVGSVISLSTDTEELVMDTNINSFVHDDLNLTVVTNSQYGYTLTIEDADASSNMVHDDSTVTDVITSDYIGEKTSSTMDANTWGYSIDNGATYYRIPENGTPTVVDHADGILPNGTATKAVDFGVKTGILTSGTYADTIIFTAYTNGAGGLPENGNGINYPGTKVSGTMQDFSCSSLAADQETRLKDSRDNSAYPVKKTLDGRCWMLETLRLQNRTLTTADSNVTQNRQLYEFKSPDELLSVANTYVLEHPNTTDQELADFIIPRSLIFDHNYGGYYLPMTAFATDLATATELNHESNDGDYNYPTSICPKGWHIPTIDELNALGAAYEGENILSLGYLKLSGYYSVTMDENTGQFSYVEADKGVSGHIITSTLRDYKAQALHYDEQGASYHDMDDFIFYNVTCIAN